VSLYVLDASVAAKWVLPPRDEPFHEEALALLKRYVEGEVSFLIPDLFWPEVANILWKCARMGRVEPEAAEAGIEGLRGLSLQGLTSEEVIREAMEIALVTGRTVYDSVYVAAAITREAVLITADERLVNGLGARFPVRWIGGLHQ